MEEDGHLESGIEADGLIGIGRSAEENHLPSDMTLSCDSKNMEHFLQTEYPSGVVSAEDFFGLACRGNKLEHFGQNVIKIVTNLK